jgi:hypothetical protein
MALFCAHDGPSRECLQRLVDEACDICLVEGDRQSSRPKVLLTRNRKDFGQFRPENILATYGPVPGLEGTAHFETDRIDDLAAFLIEHLAPAEPGEAR